MLSSYVSRPWCNVWPLIVLHLGVYCRPWADSEATPWLGAYGRGKESIEDPKSTVWDVQSVYAPLMHSGLDIG